MARIHYWNQASFDALVAVASVLRSDQSLELLALYCELRGKGLRQEAFRKLDTFLTAARARDPKVQRKMVLRILEIHRGLGGAHQFLSMPLKNRFIEPVLETWHREQPENAVPLRELALLRRDTAMLWDALSVCEHDDEVRVALASELLRYVEYATHHLLEGLFIGDETEAAGALDEAKAVLEGLTDPSEAQRLWEELKAMTLLLSDWGAYRAAPQGTFPEWCRERGHDHRWWSIVYYDD